MHSALSARLEFLKNLSKTKQITWLLLVGIGMLMPLGFAPFHFPGAALLSLSLLYRHIQHSSVRKAFFQGLAFGLGMFGLGVSWISISIHSYGHLAYIWSYLITGIFVLYLALFPALAAWSFRFLCYPHLASIQKALLFAAVWCATEYLRAHCFTGFPWLLVGFGQIDTPLQYLLPIVGLYSLSFIAIFAACCLTYAVQRSHARLWLFGFVLLLITPQSLQSLQWTKPERTPLSVGVIQANLSMRDKWDDTLFWQIIEHYHTALDALIGKKQLIFLPESAIPVPAAYIQDFLTGIHLQAKKHNTAILLGIPEEIKHNKSEPNDDAFYNSLASLGLASGVYHKQHLVPFGEYVPHRFAYLLKKLDLIMSNMQAGHVQQSLVQAHHRPFATLICYELAYPQLLRAQLPTAEWIVSLSDDGWFGHSFAVYQHLQMAQALSLLTHRYQIVANNDGLSSIITPQGQIKDSLPAFTSGILEGHIYPIHGATPWVRWGDMPIFCLCGIIVVWRTYKKLKKG
jgi:apolipoprotein N-acyltransferase